jgi:hypothetical protein
LLQLTIEGPSGATISAGEIRRTKEVSVEPNSIDEGVRPLTVAISATPDVKNWPGDEPNHVGKYILRADGFGYGLHHIDPDSGRESDTVGNKKFFTITSQLFGLALCSEALPDGAGNLN